MKKIIPLLSLAIMLAGGTVRAQVPIALPNASFEQWTDHQGYSVTVLFYPLQVYGAYTTPAGWDYMSYPVNETVSFMGMNVNVNTAVPLVMASADTAGAPHGSTALKLRSFMVGDIVRSTVLSLAGSSIDPSLTQQVIPSILSTGAIDLEALMPVLTSLLADTGGLDAMLPTLVSMDAADFVSGGLPLGGLRPGRLTGYYKYASASSGDNGGVVIVGTRYNSVTHKRDIVGAGLNTALYDTLLFTPFAVDYLPLDAYVAGSASPQPDSLVVLLLSSAGTNMQQGSLLWLDSLTIWSAPDTCADIVALSALPGIHEATVAWTVHDPADSVEVEYGPEGFTPGTGTAATAAGGSIALTGLEAGTTYDVYACTVCNDSVYGNWAAASFATLPDTCASVLGLTLQLAVYDGPEWYALEWSGSSQPDHWEVEYGPQGFSHGTGSLVLTSEPRFDIYTVDSLAPNTWYDFYVRSVCSEGVYGEWDSVHYRTLCASVTAIAVDSSAIAVDANGLWTGYKLRWDDPSDNLGWGVYYGIYNSDYPDLPWGTYVSVEQREFDFPPLQPGEVYCVELTPYCGDRNYGEQGWKCFRTPTLTGIDNADSGQATVSVSPNPAHGRCTVATGTPATLRLYSLDGRLLQTAGTTGEACTLTLPAQGLYLLRATTASGTATVKIVNE